jgi:hypothetical protein
MLKKILAVALFLTGTSTANAEDWVGQPAVPQVTGSIGPFGANTPELATAPIVTTCQPGATPPPCSGAQTLAYTVNGPFTGLSAVPAGAGPGSNVGVFVEGAYSDPTSPTGLSDFGGEIALDAFAKSSTVEALAATTSGLSAQINSLGGTVGGLTNTVNGLSSQMHALSADLAQVQQQLAMQDKTLRQGVAMSLAMDGTGTLGPDEHFAMSMNWGTFGGQNGVAGSVAVRAADHLTFDGGIGTGLHGGLVGARAGVRIAW